MQSLPEHATAGHMPPCFARDLDTLALRARSALAWVNLMLVMALERASRRETDEVVLVQIRCSRGAYWITPELHTDTRPARSPPPSPVQPQPRTLSRSGSARRPVSRMGRHV